MPNLNKALKYIRDNAENTTEKGTGFESLVKLYFEHDDLQKQYYEKIQTYKDWASTRKNFDPEDIGIDLVAKLRGKKSFASIQCKFFRGDREITKKQIDSWISASSSDEFSELLLIDTSLEELGSHADYTIKNLSKNKQYRRIPADEMDRGRIDWLNFISENDISLKKKNTLRPHQSNAINDVKKGFEKDDRGKMIMACGTGKTFTALKFAEQTVGQSGMVLYMVPSLALMSQTISEWKSQSELEIFAYSACSDDKVGKNKKKDEDRIILRLSDLAFPATTDSEVLSNEIKHVKKNVMKVIFSTYQSIDVISKAQKKYGLDKFDLIICDEAHRTTGETLGSDDESNFVKIHKDENISGLKRLYMTATPKIYAENVKKRAEKDQIEISSMDDVLKFGKTLHYHSFGKAVENNLLTDYKVVVLAVDEGIVNENIQSFLKSSDSQLKLDEATKVIGCYKALGKIGFDDDKSLVQKTTSLEKKYLPNKVPMKRALAFTRTIASSELFVEQFNEVVREYETNEKIEDKYKLNLKVNLKHVDGKHNAQQRANRLNWLEGDIEENSCHILSNAKCLSEGVDVPALDAIMFLHPRKSHIDVIQAVGRVMRRAKDKKMGYVILPITVSSGMSPEQVLNKDKNYDVVWQLLNALRAHDERLEGKINSLKLGEDISNVIDIIGIGNEELDAVTGVVKELKKEKKDKKKKEDEESEDEEVPDEEDNIEQLGFKLEDFSKAIKAKIVEKCGTRDYWENWATDIARIALSHITSIKTIVSKKNTRERNSFLSFLEEIRDDLNPEITELDAIEMLAQHIITRPVFETLFQGNRFTTENAVSKAMEIVLAEIYTSNIDKESRTLERFYESVKRRAAGIVTSTGRQTLILELYDRFFRNAFPLMTQKLGIVYTPVEVVDFIIHSVEDVMQEEFGSTLGNDGVHILDPFTGTGTFISRLLQSGIMSKEQIRRKFKSEIHANEIVLLAYYIACINIEAVYDNLVKDNQYQSFDGMVLTDTFQLYEQERDMIANLLPDNSERRTNQKKQGITVIIGNPPYSVGQVSENDNAKNINYPNLEKRIENTYVAMTKSTNKNSLYDSYVKAIRWASDRIQNKGIIGFITNNGFLDGISFDGLRQSLNREFDRIYLINLKGNSRLGRELSKKEGGNIFDVRVGIMITIFVKLSNANNENRIFYYELDDFLNKQEKLNNISKLKSISGIIKGNKFSRIKPDINNDWLNHSNPDFLKYRIIGEKKNRESAIFPIHTAGVMTQRDAWCNNFSRKKLENNIKTMISNYNIEVEKFSGKSFGEFKNLINYDNTKINWSDKLYKGIEKSRKIKLEPNSIRETLYRPFTTTNLYYSDFLNERHYQLSSVFPNKETQNKIIVLSGIGSSEFSCLMTNKTPCRDLLTKCQCFPLKTYNQVGDKKEDLFDFSKDNINKGISSNFVKEVNKRFNTTDITTDEIFFYTYLILHHRGYLEKFKFNLKKSLPRIPIVKNLSNFKSFVQLGKKLSDIHINFDSVDKYNVNIKEGNLNLTSIDDPKIFYKVKKMKFLNKNDKSSVIYNKNITIENIPLEAYEYVVNGKPALEWVMERQCVMTDETSGIVNDANDYANETMNNPAYPLELFQRIITVSLETMKIVKSSPKLDI